MLEGLTRRSSVQPQSVRELLYLVDIDGRLHEETNLHKINLEKSHSVSAITSYFANDKTIKIQNNAKVAELKRMAFVVEHNLPFLVIDRLPDLIRSACPDSKTAQEIKCSRTKTTAIRLLYDFFDEKRNEVTDCFFGLLEVTESTAEALFAAICNYLQEHNLNLEKLLGFAADNATSRRSSISSQQLNAAAKEFDIKQITLIRFIKKLKSESGTLSMGYAAPRQVFSSEQEDSLKKYLSQMASIVYGYSPKDVRRLAYE
ncbi:hypothetical protein ILUMI_19550, partial [Ignelater luminosus]